MQGHAEEEEEEDEGGLEETPETEEAWEDPRRHGSLVAITSAAKTDGEEY